jgi:hypothetical protein
VAQADETLPQDWMSRNDFATGKRTGIAEPDHNSLIYIAIYLLATFLLSISG